MKLKTILVWATMYLLSLPISYGQQKISISGQVVDGRTNEPIIGANVYTKDFKYGTTTDEYGRYAIRIDTTYKVLIASYLGYAPSTCTLSQNGCMFELSPVELTEVVVKANGDSPQEEIGHFSPSIELIKSLPSLGGDVDIVKSLTLLPGVSGGVEGSSSMSVRGGNLSHNLIMLDGTPVYNSSHLFGFMSSFNPEAVKHVDLYKGGFPVQYGGRLASVLDVTMKDGNMRYTNTDLSIGLVNNSLLTEGPIIEDKLSYMLAGRSFNPGWLLSGLSIASENSMSYFVYDINAKLKYKISDKQSLFVSYFRGKDRLRDDTDFSTIKKIKWGNQVVSIRYFNQLANRLFIDAGVYYNQYQYGNSSREIAKKTNALSSYSKSKINDTSAKLKGRLDVLSNYRIQFGAEISQKKFTPVDYERNVLDKNGKIIDSNKDFVGIQSLDYVGYLGHELQIGKRVDVYAGLRSMLYKNDQFSFFNTDLRSSISYKLNNMANVKIAYDEMHQPFHLLSTVGSVSPNEIWLPGTEAVPPSKSQQWSIGYTQKIPALNAMASIEVYDKQMTNLVRYRPGAAYVFTDDLNWQNQVLGKGAGKAKGVELFFSRSTGRLTGWVGYTYAQSLRKYAETNHGKWFASNYDRRHDIELTAAYKLSKKWTFSGTFVYSTGRPLTLPSAVYKIPTTPTVFLRPQYNVVFRSINASRTRDYHRLDISFKKEYTNRKGRESSWTFGVYNAYLHRNTFAYELKFKENTENNSIKVILKEKSFLNFIPSFNYRIKF